MKTMMNTYEKGQFETLLQKKEVTILVFSANWCPDCTFIKPFMPKLIEKYKHFNFVYVDRDENIDVAQQLMVMGIPSFVAVGHGKELSRFVSRFRKTEQQIDEFLEKIVCE